MVSNKLLIKLRFFNFMKIVHLYFHGTVPMTDRQRMKINDAES